MIAILTLNVISKFPLKYKTQCFCVKISAKIMKVRKKIVKIQWFIFLWVGKINKTQVRKLINLKNNQKFLRLPNLPFSIQSLQKRSYFKSWKMKATHTMILFLILIANCPGSDAWSIMGSIFDPIGAWFKGIFVSIGKWIVNAMWVLWVCTYWFFSMYSVVLAREN